MSVKNPQLTGSLPIQNRSNFVYIEGSTAWLYDCPLHISPLYIAEQCYTKSLIIILILSWLIKFVDLIIRQTFDHANQIPCENTPRSVFALDPDTDQYYVLTPQPIDKNLLYSLNPLKFEALLASTPLLLKILNLLLTLSQT